jgi:hypothetical protein
MDTPNSESLPQVTTPFRAPHHWNHMPISEYLICRECLAEVEDSLTARRAAGTCPGIPPGMNDF